MLVTKTCLHCNLQFKARSDKLGKYCSKSCSVKHSPRIPSTKVKVCCKQCNKEVLIKFHRLKTFRYCSRECLRLNMPKKENHPNWKGGNSERTWKSRAIIRSKKKTIKCCEICASSNDLQGHHIKTWKEAANLREDPSNIKILCVKCHADQHKNLKNFIISGLSL